MGASIAIAITILVFIIIGIVLYRGKGAFLIAGYNTLPEEEKNKYDTAALCKFIGKMMFALSFSMVLWIFAELFAIPWLFAAGVILFMAIIVFMLVYLNTGNRFKK